MAKARKTADFRPLGVPMSPESHYSDDDLAKIIEAGSPLKELSHVRKRNMHARLNKAAAAYRRDAIWQDRPAPSVVRDELSEMASLLRKIRAMLGISHNDFTAESVPHDLRFALRHAADIHAEKLGGFPEFPPWTHEALGETFVQYDAGPALDAALLWLARLEVWASDAAMLKRQIVRNTRGVRPSRQADEALNGFLQNSLAPIYRQYIGRKPGTSPVDGSNGGGPWVRFMGACLEPLGQPTAAEALVKRWRRIRRQPRDKSILDSF